MSIVFNAAAERLRRLVRATPIGRNALFALALAATCAVPVTVLASEASATSVANLAELIQLKGPNTNIYDNFGAAQAIDGEVAVVGAPSGAANVQLLPFGDAYVYRRSGNSWLQEAHLVAPDAAYGDKFGNAVAISGNVI